MRRKGTAALLALLTAAALVPAALAGGGDYVFDGGTPTEQAQVRAALAASSFDWSLVPAQITIHIAPGSDSDASRGAIWLDSNLLDAGRFAWGTVQHEYAHQVDFLLLDQAQRDALHTLVGGTDWCYEQPALAHDQHGCERFADTLAAAYWPSQDNTTRPTVAPARFRALLDSLLGR